MVNFYEQGLASSMEKIAFYGLAAKGLASVGSKMLGYGKQAYGYGKNAVGKIPSPLKNDFSKIKSGIANSNSYGRMNSAVKNSESYNYLKNNYKDIRNKFTSFQEAHPKAVQIGLGAAGLAGGTYLGNRMYRSLQQIGRQIPEDFQNNVQ